MAKKEVKKEAKEGRLEAQRKVWAKDPQLGLSDRLVKAQIKLTLEKLEGGSLSVEEADKANKYLDKLAAEGKARKLKFEEKKEVKAE